MPSKKPRVWSLSVMMATRCSKKLLEASQFNKWLNLLRGKDPSCTGLRGNVDFVQVASVKGIRRKFADAYRKRALTNQVRHSTPCIGDTLVIQGWPFTQYCGSI
jgi:hypothetical protein